MRQVDILHGENVVIKITILFDWNIFVDETKTRATTRHESVASPAEKSESNL